MPFLNEAAYALMEGVAEPEAIDTVAKLGFAHPMGPLALADLIGLDTCVAIMEVLHEGLGDPKYAPCPLLRQLRRGRAARPQVRPRLLRVRLSAVDPLVDAELDAHVEADDEFVERAFREVLRRPPDPEARERARREARGGDALARDASCTSSSPPEEAARVRALDDAVALGLGARARERAARVAPGADRHGRARRRDPVGALAARRDGPRARGRLRVRRACLPRRAPARGRRARRGRPRRAGRRRAGAGHGGRPLAAVPGRLVRPGAPRLDARARRRRQHGVRARGGGRPGLARRRAPRARSRRSARDGRLLVTVPLGEPGDHGWFRLDDVDGWNGLFAAAGLFVEEQEAYELGEDGWRAAPAFRACRSRLRRPRPRRVGRALRGALAPAGCGGS